MTKPETTTVRDRHKDEELRKAGASRIRRMREAGVRSYSELRSLVDGKSPKEYRGLDQFDLAADLLPEGRDVPWDEFCELARERKLGYSKVDFEGLLLTLRANGAASASGVPPRVTRLPRRAPVREPQRPVFTATDAREDKDSEIAFLRQQNADLKRRLAEVERAR
jgi:hypothetical protein